MSVVPESVVGIVKEAFCTLNWALKVPSLKLRLGPKRGIILQ